MPGSVDKNKGRSGLKMIEKIGKEEVTCKEFLIECTSRVVKDVLAGLEETNQGLERMIRPFIPVLLKKIQTISEDDARAYCEFLSAEAKRIANIIDQEIL